MHGMFDLLLEIHTLNIGMESFCEYGHIESKLDWIRDMLTVSRNSNTTHRKFRSHQLYQEKVGPEI